MASPRLTPEQIEASKLAANKKRKLRKLWGYSDLTFGELCDEMGMTDPELRAYAASIGLATRHEPSVYIPTPEEIRVAAAEIRSKWTEIDRESRLGAGAFARITTGHHYGCGGTPSDDLENRVEGSPRTRRKSSRKRGMETRRESHETRDR